MGTPEKIQCDFLIPVIRCWWHDLLMFTLHPLLAADTIEIATWGVSRVRLMKDANYPWLLLIPARAGLTGMHQLNAADATTVMSEISLASRALDMIYTPARINVAALGNVVPQLHIHVIARFEDDPAWPGPVWGTGLAQDYSDEKLQRTLASVKQALLDCAP